MTQHERRRPLALALGLVSVALALEAGAESEFATDFSKHTVPFGEITSGGPPKDGIPAIEAPRFVSIEKGDEWLHPREPVVLVQIGDDARAYT